MSRSVSIPAGAELIAYQDVTWVEDPEEYDAFLQQLCTSMTKLWPSIESADWFIGREDQVIAENGHAHFGVSAYCGLAAVWAVPKDDEERNLHRHWLNQIRPTFDNCFGQLNKIATASNGEAFSERKELAT